MRRGQFRSHLKERRCVTPCAGFYEWREEDGKQLLPTTRWMYGWTSHRRRRRRRPLGLLLGLEPFAVRPIDRAMNSPQQKDLARIEPAAA